MENRSESQLLRFLYIGETASDFRRVLHLISRDSLPIKTYNQSNLSKALFDLNRIQQPTNTPQAIVLNADLNGQPAYEFLRHYQKHISSHLEDTLFYIASKEQQPLEHWNQEFSFLTGFIKKPYQRQNFEKIATQLLGQFLPPLNLTIDLGN